MDATAVARRWHRDLLGGGRLDTAAEICAPTMLVHGPGVAADAPLGPAFGRAFAMAVRAAFSIEALTTSELMVNEDRVALHWTIRAIHVGRFLDIEPSGRRVEISGIDLFRMADGRIAEIWQAYDRLAVLARLEPRPLPDWDLHQPG